MFQMVWRKPRCEAIKGCQILLITDTKYPWQLDCQSSPLSSRSDLLLSFALSLSECTLKDRSSLWLSIGGIRVWNTKITYSFSVTYICKTQFQALIYLENICCSYLIACPSATLIHVEITSAHPSNYRLPTDSIFMRFCNRQREQLSLTFVFNYLKVRIFVL